MSQVALAKKAGTTGETWSLIERGLANPTWATVSDIAKALGVTTSELAQHAERTQKPCQSG
jgi:DNA-binding XRE family transcriptional regulator